MTSVRLMVMVFVRGGGSELAEGFDEAAAAPDAEEEAAGPGSFVASCEAVEGLAADASAGEGLAGTGWSRPGFGGSPASGTRARASNRNGLAFVLFDADTHIRVRDEAVCFQHLGDFLLNLHFGQTGDVQAH